VHALQVGHHGTHHTSGQATTHQQGRHLFVAAINEITQKIVHKALRQPPGFHVGIHIDVFHLKTGFFEHGLNGNHIGVNHSPGKGFHGYIEVIGTSFGHFQHGSRGKSRSSMTVVFHLDIGVSFFDLFRQKAQESGTTYTCHIFEADFVRSKIDQFVGQGGIIINRMNGRMSDAHRCLGYHTGFSGILDGQFEVAGVVQATKRAGNVGTLGLLDLEHQAAHISGNWIHADTV